MGDIGGQSSKGGGIRQQFANPALEIKSPIFFVHTKFSERTENFSLGYAKAARIF